MKFPIKKSRSGIYFCMIYVTCVLSASQVLSLFVLSRRLLTLYLFIIYIVASLDLLYGKLIKYAHKTNNNTLTSN